MQVEDVQCKGKDAAGVEILEVYIKQSPHMQSIAPKSACWCILPMTGKRPSSRVVPWNH